MILDSKFDLYPNIVLNLKNIKANAISNNIYILKLSGNNKT